MRKNYKKRGWRISSPAQVVCVHVEQDYFFFFAGFFAAFFFAAAFLTATNTHPLSIPHASSISEVREG
jgi:allophanate hydrolase subunit 1